MTNVNIQRLLDDAESIEFSGKVIVKMAQDPKIHKLNSKIVISAEVIYCSLIVNFIVNFIFSVLISSMLKTTEYAILTTESFTATDK